MRVRDAAACTRSTAMVFCSTPNESGCGHRCASKKYREWLRGSCVLRTSQSGWRGLMPVEAAFTLKMARWEKAWAEVEALPVPAVEGAKNRQRGRSVDS